MMNWLYTIIEKRWRKRFSIQRVRIQGRFPLEESPENILL
jgi:hypothetical protein